jgi:hypothetical protein
MIASLIVIARSEATKQSRFPTRRVGKCVGEANLGSQTQRFANCVGEANLVFIFSSMYIEIAMPPLWEARNGKKENSLSFLASLISL